jgi:hypothetical protein
MFGTDDANVNQETIKRSASQRERIVKEQNQVLCLNNGIAESAVHQTGDLAMVIILLLTAGLYLYVMSRYFMQL